MGSRDHPVEYVAPHVLSFSEIRHWLRELLCNPLYGICTVYGGKAALARQMGVASQSLQGKLRGEWIFPSEQTRLTRVIMQVRRGEIRCVQRTERTAEFVVMDPPKPPAPEHQQAVWQFKPGGKLQMRPVPVTQPAFPSLRGAFDRAKFRR